MLPKINSVFYWSFVVNVKWMTIMKDIKLCESWKVGNELSLFDGVCKCQKWVENANQTQLKPIIWYPSWYFSRGGWKMIASSLQNPDLRPCPEGYVRSHTKCGPDRFSRFGFKQTDNHRQTKTFVFWEAYPFLFFY